MTNSNGGMKPLVKSKVKLRAAVKGLQTSEIEQLIGNLTLILKSEKQKEKSKAEAAKKAKIAKIKAMMDESGLKPADIQAATGKGKRKARGKAKAKRKAPAKYRLVVDGQEHLWSGRGRPPKVFKEYMDAGNSKESCAI